MARSSVKDLNNLLLEKTLSLTAKALAPLLICPVGHAGIITLQETGGQFSSLGHFREPHGDAGCLHLPLLHFPQAASALQPLHKSRMGTEAAQAWHCWRELQGPGGHLRVQPGCP